MSAGRLAPHSAGLRPVIGLVSCIKPIGDHNFHTVGVKYVDAIESAAGGLPVLIPSLGNRLPIRETLALLDGLLLTGSASNVAPARYGASLSGPQHFDLERDDTVLRLIAEAVREGVPILGICRGFQELNVAFGGSLTQCVHEEEGRLDHRADEAEALDTQYGPAHTVRVEQGGALHGILSSAGVAGQTITVNSVHSQGIERLGAGLVAEAHAEDGLIEAIRVEAAKRFALAVQWHPEWKVMDNPISRAIFAAFGAACAARRLGRDVDPHLNKWLKLLGGREVDGEHHA